MLPSFIGCVHGYNEFLIREPISGVAQRSASSKKAQFSSV